MNPKLSLILNSCLGWYSHATHIQQAGHAPDANGFTLQGLELAASASVDPTGHSYYQRRYERFNQLCQAKMSDWKKRLKPLRGTKVIVYHQSWIYFIDWAGFQQVDALEPKPGIPPSANHIMRLLVKVRKQGIKQVWQETYHPQRLAKVFARKAKAKHLVLPSMVGAEENIKTLADKFDRLVELIADQTGNTQ